MSDNQEKLDRIKALVYPSLSDSFMHEALLKIQYEFSGKEDREKIRRVLADRYGSDSLDGLPDKVD